MNIDETDSDTDAHSQFTQTQDPSQTQTQTLSQFEDEALLQDNTTEALTDNETLEETVAETVPETVPETVAETVEEAVADNDSNNNSSVNSDTDSITNKTNNSDKNTQSTNRRWIPKSKYRRMNKSILKQQINLVTNLSDMELTKGQKSLLNKGLNFCPNPEKVNLTQISADCYHLERNMAWKYIFPPGSGNYNQDNNNDNNKTPFDNNRKVNMPDYFPQEISSFSESVRSDLIGAQHNKVPPNLNPDEKEALKELNDLQDKGDIVIQPADKNAGVCVMNRADYVNEAERQLNDTYVDTDGVTQNYYKKVDPREVDRQFAEVKAVLNEGLQRGYISKKDYNVLLPPKPKASRLYLLPKIHKPYEGFPKCRPIVSGSGCNTERISWFCDNIIKDKVKQLDSYIEDTPDLLRKINDINESQNIPDDAKPIAIDIKSMYSNIPLQEGLDAFEDALNARTDKSIPTEFVSQTCYGKEYFHI